jgi:hypothetical protein
MGSLRSFLLEMRLPALLAALAVACSGPSTQGAVASTAQALGKADSGDSADRACQVVLRSVGRGPGTDDYETDGDAASPLYLWRGVIDVADEVPVEATVHVLYHRASDPTWWEVEAVADAGVVYGFRRYAFTLSDQLWGPGGAEEPVQVVAFVRDPDGGRLFDHNRFAGDFDNLVLDGANGFSAYDGGVCQPLVGSVFFADDWSESTFGARRQGGWLELRYDLDRLPQCRGTHNGYPAWDVVAYARFLPGGQEISGSVRELVTNNGTPTNQATEKPLAVRIPDDAQSVQVWFHNYSGAGSTCEAWDSNLDANYAFDVWPAPDHPRCAGVVKARDLHAESDQMVQNEAWCLAYDVTVNADATSCELRVEGFGDGHMGHYGIPFDWYVAYLRVGATDGEVLNAGLWARVHDNLAGTDAEVFALGLPLGDGLYRAGLPHLITGFQSMQAADVRLDAFAFFVDVRRADGNVERLWISRGGANYTLADAFGAGATTEYIPYGHLDWAPAGAGVLESNRACR